jgi:hypothetical protein
MVVDGEPVATVAHSRKRATIAVESLPPLLERIPIVGRF